ncbi:TPA: hypothetical protein DCE37_17480 [Candidatus Latescibacteria bacterium]|nr:hypothetical protein [Candidatus Latescibacterota bacterium]
MKPIRLSTTGSDRATGYNMSSKLIRTDDALYTGWLDAPDELGDTVKIRFGTHDPASGELQSIQTIGEGIDNHCGPALAMDPAGRMHAIIGHHHGPFLYRWSDAPSDEESWSAPVALGPDDTYPSLAIDAEGTLHLAHREKADRWQLWYRRKKKGADWEPPVSVAISPTPGYNHYMMSLTVGPTGTLHLVFQFHFSETGNAADCKCRAAVYLRSLDGGDTWIDDADREPALPVTLETMVPLYDCPDGGDDRHAVRVANHVVDSQDRAWFFASVHGAHGGIIYRRDSDGWTEFDLGKWTGGLNLEGGRSSSLSRSLDGSLVLGLGTSGDGSRTSWFDSSLELYYVTFDENGENGSCNRLTGPDAEAANWLPALENWDWNHTDICCQHGHWMTWTRGLNAGGIGGNNKSALKTEVYLTRLE